MILVFGAGGQLGQELTQEAQQRGLALTGVTHADADITDTAAVAAAIAAAAPSVVVNAAAYNQVDRAEADPEAALATNATGPGNLATQCSKAGCALIHVSTDYVFDGALTRPYREDDTTNPLGAYGRSKLEGERLVRERLPRHLILRTAWLYGVYGSNFVKGIAKRAAAGEALSVVDDQVGSPTTTRHLAAAIFEAIRSFEDARETAWGTYHVAGGGAVSRYDFAQAIVEYQAVHTEVNPEITPISAEAYGSVVKRPGYSALDSRKFEAAFGLGAENWKGALKQTVDELFKGAQS